MFFTVDEVWRDYITSLDPKSVPMSAKKLAEELLKIRCRFFGIKETMRAKGNLLYIKCYFIINNEF